MRSKGTVIFFSAVGILLAILAFSYFRPKSTNASAPYSGAFQPYDSNLTPANSAAAPMTASTARMGQNVAAPIVVRCGDTLVTVQPPNPGDAQAVRVDCNQIGLGQGQSFVQPTAVVQEEELVAPPVTRRVVRRRAVRPQTVNNYYYPDDERERPQYRRNRRSWQKEALIIGGSAGAGTAIGALAGGKKGAGIGAISGGVAGLVYDLATRDK